MQTIARKTAALNCFGNPVPGPIGPAPVNLRKFPGLYAFRTNDERLTAVDALAALGFNYFVGYVDSGDPARPYGLSASYAVWAGRGGYRRDLEGLVH